VNARESARIVRGANGRLLSSKYVDRPSAKADECGFCPSWHAECDGSAIRLRRRGVVVLEQSAEPHSAKDTGLTRTKINATFRGDAAVSEPLMYSFRMVMDHVFSDRAMEMPLAERNDPVETLAANRAHPSLHECVQVRAAAREPADPRPMILEEPAELSGEERVAVDDQHPRLPEEAVEGVGQVPRDLHHPLLAGIARDPSDMDSPGLELHDEEDVVADEAAKGEHLDREEVGPEEPVPVRREEVAPGGLAAPFRRGDDPVLVENSHDGRPGHGRRRARELRELVADPGVTPGLVGLGQSNDPIRDPFGDSRAPRTAAVGSVVILSDQSPVPTTQCIGCSDGGELRKNRAVEPMGLLRETASLLIGEPGRLPAPLLSHNGVLGREVVDHSLLSAVHPSGAEDNEKLKPWSKPNDRHDESSFPPPTRVTPPGTRFQLLALAPALRLPASDAVTTQRNAPVDED